jgi:hypothetical protein
MIGRRDVLGGGLVALLVPNVTLGAALPVPSAGHLAFDVWRGSRQLGTHDLVFHPTPDGVVVDVAVDIAYRIGPITLFHYTHQARERWAGGQVVELKTTTNDNGSHYQVEGRRDKAGLTISANDIAAYVAPADALPATHWNHRELDGPWINTQNGKLVRPKVSPEGMITVETAESRPLRVRNYALSGPIQLDLWYDEAMTWAGLSFVKAGAQVRYARRT